MQSDRVEISYLEDVGVAHLTVHQVGPADSGDYACVVQGEVVLAPTGERQPKTITSTSQVTITGKSIMSWFLSTILHPINHTSNNRLDVDQ